MTQLLMIGTTELIIIGGAVLLLFGGKKIPELMRSLGQGVKNFKQGINEPYINEDKENPSDKQEVQDESEKNHEK